MLRAIHLSLLLTPIIFACGMGQEEHQQKVQQALDGQKATFDAEMKKMQEHNSTEMAQRDEAIKNKDVMIGGLEHEVKKLGGNLANVQSELGERVTQLASTKTQLAASKQELDQLRKLREAAEQEAAQLRSLKEQFKKMMDSGKLEVTKRKGRILLKLPDNILFPSGSRKLKKTGREALVSVAEVLSKVEGRDFIIAGHTDNVPLKRSKKFKDNWELSTARAVTVVSLMIKNGVNPERIAAAGYGEHDPISENKTKDGRMKNRRLEIILMPKVADIGI